MQALMNAVITMAPGGEITVGLRTTDAAHRLGALRVADSWTVSLDDDGLRLADPLVALAFAVETLGSRMLRVARTLDQQRPLFGLDLPHGGAA